MKIIYVQPPLKASSLKAKLMYFLRGRKLNVNQEGFFVQSLIPTMSIYLNELKGLILEDGDILVVNSKATLTGTEINLYDQFCDIKTFSCKKALFVSNDMSSFMPEDIVLDLFDIIFKREPYRDLSLYKIDERNRKKIRRTMLPCPLVNPSQLSSLKFHDTVHEKFDVFFNGQATHKERVKICEMLRQDSSISFLGGLQSTTKTPVSSEIYFKKMSRREYKKMILQSSINLAIEGIGNFTYRHLELLSQGAFIICSSKIKELDLPIELTDGEHYVAYEDMEDLVVKIRYYLERPSERLRIAKNGFDRFKRDYSFEKHGKFLRSQIMNI